MQRVMSPVARTELAGWGLYPTSSAELVEPESPRGVADAIDVPSVIARGLGRSYGDPAINGDGRVVGLTKLDRILAFDESTGLAQCEAGVSLSALIDRLAPRGWFPMITPGTRYVTIGGCIANDVHGKAHHAQGSFLECVRELTLLLASGEVVTVSRTKDPELFYGCFGGMGLLGIILEATVQLRKVETTYFTQKAFVADDLEGLLALMEEHDAAFPYSVANIDPLATGRKLGRGVLTVGDHASLTDLPKRFAKDPLASGGRSLVDIPVRLPDVTLNPVTLVAVHAVIKQFLSHAAPTAHADSFFYPLDMLTNWNRGYGRRGFTQYQFVIPRTDGARHLRALLEVISATSNLPTLNVLKRLGPANAAPLSFPMDGFTLAIDFPIREGTRALTERLDAMVLEAGGRIYLGKDAFVGPQTLARMYPRLGEWKQLKKRVDPQGRFQSDLSRRTGLTG